MNYTLDSRRAFLGKSALALVGMATFTSQEAMASIVDSAPFEGYNPFTHQTTDLRTVGSIMRPIRIQGVIYTKNCVPQKLKTKIEVWHLTPGKKTYNNRGYFYTDEQGKYSFVTEFPNRVEGKKARIYFKLTTEETTEFTELILDRNTAYINDTHWEKHQHLTEKMFPTYSKDLFETTIEFNISI